jgi:hypothetical protein
VHDPLDVLEQPRGDRDSLLQLVGAYRVGQHADECSRGLHAGPRAGWR